MKTILITLVVIYVVGLFIAYFVFCYKTAERNYRSDKYETNLSEGQVCSMIFWPIMLVVIILIAPFKLVEKIAIHIKEKANPKSVTADKIASKYSQYI